MKLPKIQGMPLPLRNHQKHPGSLSEDECLSGSMGVPPAQMADRRPALQEKTGFQGCRGEAAPRPFLEMPSKTSVLRVLGKAPRDFAQKGADQYSHAAVGFTLVEVLVAMVLTAMVITLLATAIRSGLLSWRKLGPESQADIFAHAVPVSLGRYLEYTPTEATPWKGQQGQLFPLCGGVHGITFYSTYGPSGSNRQGLRLIGYLYDPSRRILEVYDLDLFEKEDQATDWVVLAETLLNGRQDLGPPMSRYGDVTAFEVAYGEVNPSDSSGRELQWKDQWPCEETLELPRQVRVVFGVRTGSTEKVNTWIFPTKLQ